MAKSNRDKSYSPAKSTRARENQLIALAYDLAEERLRNGTATSQMITELIRRGGVREKLELAKIQSDLDVANAKIKQYKSSEEIKELYSQAMNAMRTYNGDEEDIYAEDDGYYY